MGQLDSRHIIEGVRIEDCQRAAVSGAVVHVSHQHAVVLVRVG